MRLGVIIALLSVMVVIGAPFASAIEGDVMVNDVALSIGDVFSYTPLHDDATIRATGDAIYGSDVGTEGAFLQWDGRALTGTPSEAGTWTVTLWASWTENGSMKEAYQVIRFTVGESEGTGQHIVFDEGAMNQWFVQSTATEDAGTSQDSVSVLGAICLVTAGGLAMAFVIRREPSFAVLAVFSAAIAVCDFLGVI